LSSGGAGAAIIDTRMVICFESNKVELAGGGIFVCSLSSHIGGTPLSDFHLLKLVFNLAALILEEV
jgi:hypothetical protein